MHLVEVVGWHGVRGVLGLLYHLVLTVALGCSDFYTVGEIVRTESKQLLFYLLCLFL